VVIGFAPYSTASVLSARAAHICGATLIAIATGFGADGRRRRAPAAVRGGVFAGFFPSLTGATAIAQSLAAATFMLGGATAKRRLEEPKRASPIPCNM